MTSIDWLPMPSELKQRSKEWHEFRKKHLGASEISTLFGANKYSNVVELWKKKTGEAVAQTTSWQAQRGIDSEPIIKRMFENKMNVKLSSPTLEYKDWPILSASLDGLLYGQAVVEFKYPSKASHELAKAGKVPDGYIYQIQTQMLVAGLPLCYYVSYDGSDIVILEVKEDKELQSEILKRAKEFWQLVETRTPPEVLPEQAEVMISDSTYKAMLEEYFVNTEKLSAIEEEINRLRDKIEEMTPDSGARCSDYRIQFVARAGAVDYKKVPELNGVDLNKYRKPGTRYIKIEKINKT